MDPIGSGSAYNLQTRATHSAAAAQTAVRAQPSGHASLLALAMLSRQSFDALDAKERYGDEKEKILAGFAKSAMQSNQLRLSPNQHPNPVAQFEVQSNHDVLVIQAKLNERSEYDVLRVGFRRGSAAPVSMELTEPTGDAPGTARHPPALLNLPAEMLLQIAGRTGPRGEGVDLNLRLVSREMKGIADDQLSAKQRFCAENGQYLEAVGYSPYAMNALAEQPTAERDFVLSNAEGLHAAGYTGFEMIALAARPAAESDFVLANAQDLYTVGYHGRAMNALAAQPAAARNFVSANAQGLHTAGYCDGYMMNALAAQPAAERDFVLANAQGLHTVGYWGVALTALAGRPAAERDFILAYAQRLHTVGYSVNSMNNLAARPAAERNFVLANAQELQAAGYRDGYTINALAARPDARNAFLRQIGQRD